MNRIYKTLLDSFNKWTAAQRANLRFHADKNTPLCFGDQWALFSNGSGGA